jgi:gluconolactonase
MSAAPQIAVSAAFAAHDPAFADVVGDEPSLELVARTDAHEGPVYVAAEHAFYFTSLPRRIDGAPRVEIRRLRLETGAVTVVREQANAANGMALGPDGRLVVCEQGSPTDLARISLVDRVTGEAQTLVDGWRGLPLNSPNDVVVRSDGTVWFTDPSYGFLQGFRPSPQLGDFVYRHDPATGRTTVVADGFDKPNGLAFSPDERTLYVGDSGANQTAGSFHPGRPHHVEAFDVVDGGRLAGHRLVAVIAPGFPDGLKVDAAGRLYVSSASGVQVLTPGGEPLGEIRVPGAVNFAWGGPGRNVLYVTDDAAIWAAHLAASGADANPINDQEA